MTQPVASDATHAVMAGWKQDKPVAALMGEFSSGKSTLINFLFDREEATTKVTATPMPPIWFTYSTTDYTVGLTEDGQEVEVDLNREDMNFRRDYLAIRRGIDCDILKSIDLIDTPGLSDPNLRKDALRFLARYYDFVIWCTSASQAWRQSEKAAYEKLAAQTKELSLLLVTRFDKLRTAKDREKVHKRVVAETKGLFQTVVPLKTTKAAKIPLADRTDDPDGLWVDTGGHALMTALSTAIDNAAPQQPRAAVAAPAPPAKVKDRAPAAVTPAADANAFPDALIASLTAQADLPNNHPHSGAIVHLIASIRGENDNAPLRNSALDACTWIECDDLDVERVVSQIGREINAFQAGSTVRLDA